MVMRLTVETWTSYLFAESSSARPSASSPDGITGSVKETCRSPRCFCSRAIASERSAREPESVSSSPSMSKSARVAPAASRAAPYAFASSDALSQVVASSLPEAPPKETRTVAPFSVSCEIRDFTAELEMAYWPFHFGVQPLPSEMTKARLYVDGEPLESVPEAVVALTYGAYAVPDDDPDVPEEPDDREGDGDAVAPGFWGFGAASVLPSDAAEQPAAARANRQ